eukprot:m.189768 g.189768  ORF g.189768 m.189768 type:complete len:476 (+) comp18530_c0_seq1:152-1579(+)
MWDELLAEVSSHTASSKLKPKNILILGEEGAGKTSLVQRLQGRKHVHTEDRPQGTGLEYMYLDVKDDESEDIVERMGCYILNGNTECATLMQLLLTNEGVRDTLIMLVVDLSRPWTIMDSLEKWSHTVSGQLANLDTELLDSLKAERRRVYQNYKEYTAAAATDGKPKEKEHEEENVVLDLEEGTYTSNLGVPVIVVVAKSDSVEQLSNDLDYHQEHLDFIQLHIRRFCLEHGASLVYMGKGSKNRNALYRTIVNAAYDMPLNFAANIEDNNAVFVPSGWDNTTKISVLTDSFQSISADDIYLDVIKDNSTSATAPSRVVEAENEQDFLKKQQPLLQDQGNRAGDGDDAKDPAATRVPSGGKTAALKSDPKSALSKKTLSSSSSGERTARTSTRTTSTSSGASGSGGGSSAGTRTTRTRSTAGATATPGGKPGADGQNAEVLKNFFNSLLAKKGGAAGDKKAGATPAAGGGGEEK